MIRVLSPGLFTTVQDLGRNGFAHLGVSPAGAADPLALRIGNRLMGNLDVAAAIEMTLQGGRYEFDCDAAVALTGANFEHASIPMWRALKIQRGAVIEIGGAKTGARGYLCVRGGIDAPRIMGSASTHVLSGFGSPLKRGDSISIGEEAGGAPLERAVEPPPYRKRLRITAAAQTAEFDAQQAIRLATEIYHVSDNSNRMGLRLSGPALRPPHDGQMLSEGVALGAIQVPPSGEPIILFVDAQTTGGYPVIASVISADLPSVGQLRPRDVVTFEFASFAAARRLLLEQEAYIDAIR
ncbi:MAG TPA: biotin-dependent carboxyltransferase family protein [Bryobacteraceae bacterium]|jgi:antagonist of KipI